MRPAEAFVSYYNNKTFKFKTIWGGGYALGGGGGPGEGTSVHLNHNSRYDHWNRWAVEGEWYDDVALGTWHMVRNKHTNRCLSTVSPHSSQLVEMNCNWWDYRQFWSQAGFSFEGARPIINLDNVRARRVWGSVPALVITQTELRETGKLTMEELDTENRKYAQFWKMTECNTPSC